MQTKKRTSVAIWTVLLAGLIAGTASADLLWFTDDTTHNIVVWTEDASTATDLEAMSAPSALAWGVRG